MSRWHPTGHFTNNPNHEPYVDGWDRFYTWRKRRWWERLDMRGAWEWGYTLDPRRSIGDAYVARQAPERF